MKFFIYISLIFSLVLTSCSLEKKRYSKGFYFSGNKKTQIASSSSSIETIDNHHLVSIPYKKEEKLPVVKVESIEELSEEQYKEPIARDSNECDQIVFHDSRREDVIVKEVTPSEIKYKKCGFEEGPLYTVDPSTVSSVVYRNGTKEYYGNYVQPEKVVPDKPIDGYTTWANDPREIEIFSILSFLFGILFVPFLSILFGVISFKMFKKEPGRYKGKGFSYIGIGLGILWIMLIIVFLI